MKPIRLPKVPTPTIAFKVTPQTDPGAVRQSTAAREALTITGTQPGAVRHLVRITEDRDLLDLDARHLMAELDPVAALAPDAPYWIQVHCPKGHHVTTVAVVFTDGIPNLAAGAARSAVQPTGTAALIADRTGLDRAAKQIAAVGMDAVTQTDPSAAVTTTTRYHLDCPQCDYRGIYRSHRLLARVLVAILSGSARLTLDL